MLSAAVRRPIVVLSGFVLLLAMAVLVTLDLATLWDRMVLYSLQMQRDLHRELATAMRAVQASEGTTPWGLIGLGFLYGAFHAVGPGHGKVVISTYLATHESHLARGIVLSLLSSFVQGLTAICLVGGVALMAERSMRESQSFGLWLEALSYGLVMLIGLLLAGRGLRRLRASYKSAGKADHGSVTVCCHGHGPSARQLETALSFRQLLAMIMSIGIRPCSGAILVLILAFAMNELPTGIAAVMAMSLGTGLSISILAVLSVYARKGALALAATLETNGQGVERLTDITAVIGGLLILGFGATLFRAALSMSDHPLL